MAWLSAAPDPPKKLANKDRKRISRFDSMKARFGKAPEMPPVCGFEFIVIHWQSLGICKNTGTGKEPMSWPDVESWQNMTGHMLTPWERETLVMMSRAFVSMSEQAKEHDCQAPYLSDFGTIDKAALSAGIEQAFRQYAKSKRPKDGRP